MKTIYSILFIITLLFASEVTFCQNARDYYESGISKIQLQDNKSAIEDFSKAIELDSAYVDAYFKRAELKDDFKEYQGAIDDYTKVILLNSKLKDAYYNRGISRFKLNDNEGACNDWKKAK